MQTKIESLPVETMELPEWLKDKHPRITLKKVRSCRGNEGDAWSADVYFDGVKIAEAQDDGWGGETQVDHNRYNAKTNEWKAFNEKGWEAFTAYVDALPEDAGTEDLPFDPPLKPTVRWVIADAYEHHATLKSIRRRLKKQVVFVSATMKVGEYAAFNLRRDVTQQDINRIHDRLVKDEGAGKFRILNGVV